MSGAADQSDTEFEEETRTREEVVHSFIKTAKALAIDLHQRFDGDPTIDRIKKRIILAANALPIHIVEVAGPYIYRYREVIYSDDETVWGQFFEPNSGNIFSEDIGRAKDAENRDLATYLIPKLQALARGETSEVRKAYVDKTRELLDDYLDYLVLCGEQE